MKLLNFLPLLALVSCNAEALPDTNIQIQHYDGPVYLGTTPNCCPFCNSILKPTENVPCTPEIVYPVPNPCEEPGTCEITISIDSDEAKCDNNGKASGKSTRDNKSTSLGNYGSMIHNDQAKRRSLHNIPVTCSNPASCNYPGTVPRTCSYTIDTYGNIVPNSNQPLSSYLPINTASQSNCYQPQNTCYQPATGTEEVLVPQKFIYSFILDGDVSSKQGACDAKCYYY